MMLPVECHTSTPALDVLEPVLKDASYFVPRGTTRASATLRSTIEQALYEIEAQLSSVPLTGLKQIISRLMLHFPCPAGEKQERICNDYTEMLCDFPEDLLCAAYQHILKHHKYHTLPKIADLLTFMEPELGRRRTIKRKLDILLQQTETESIA